MNIRVERVQSKFQSIQNAIQKNVLHQDQLKMIHMKISDEKLTGLPQFQNGKKKKRVDRVCKNFL